MVCTKKNLFMTNEPFWARKWHALTEKAIWEVYFKYSFENTSFILQTFEAQ